MMAPFTNYPPNSVGGEFRLDIEEAAELAENIIQQPKMSYVYSNGGDFTKFHYPRQSF